MTDLTEQWQKGELPDGEYYVENNNREIGRLGWSEFAGWYNIKKVLAKVPSYEEYERLNWYAGNGVEENDKLKTENKWYSEQLNEAVKKIDKLKELLKECELWFTGIVGNMNDKNVGKHNRNLPIGNFEYAFKVFSQKINQALGEDK